jgi:hypothetical protein
MTTFLAIRNRSSSEAAAPTVDDVDVFYNSVQGDSYRHGDWWGNDTCWRSALDMNKILLYGTTEGTLDEKRRRKYFSLIDGIVAGDEMGPLAPTPRKEGVLIAGFDPLSVDRVATKVMGFDPELIRDQVRAANLTQYQLTNTETPIRVISNFPGWRDAIKPEASLKFRPHFAWKEYLQGTALRIASAYVPLMAFVDSITVM